MSLITTAELKETLLGLNLTSTYEDTEDIPDVDIDYNDGNHNNATFFSTKTDLYLETYDKELNEVNKVIRIIEQDILTVLDKLILGTNVVILDDYYVNEYYPLIVYVKISRNKWEVVI